eukprot:c17979_g1_i1 orf=288-677(-)
MAGVTVDVKELGHCYLFIAEVPGLKNKDVKVQIENNSILKIAGQRKREDIMEYDVKYVRLERQAGKFERKFNLPVNANVENITASCEDGLLTVMVPKNPPPQQHKARNFDVQVEAGSYGKQELGETNRR